MHDVTMVLVWLALLSAPACFTFVASHVRNANLRDTLNAAAARSGGIAYAALTQPSAIGLQSSFDQAIDRGVDHMRTSLPGTLQSLGVTGPVLENIVRGELGKLLAQDVNVSVVPTVAKQEPIPVPADPWATP